MCIRDRLSDNEEERLDSFYTDLRFGTSGIRGIIGAGTNRMNEYVVRRTTQGLADYLNEYYPAPSVVIAYDTRRKSRTFALEPAKTLRGNDIEAVSYTHLAAAFDRDSQRSKCPADFRSKGSSYHHKADRGRPCRCRGRLR